MGISKLQKQETLLRENRYIEPDDKLVGYLPASYMSRTLTGQPDRWKKGWAYFTEQRMIVFTGLLDENIVIPYDRMTELQKFRFNFLPLGLTIVYKDAEKQNGTSTERFALTKRDKWLCFLEEKSGAEVV